MIVLYDGSFEGFLQVVYDSYYKKITPIKIFKKDSFKSSLLDEDIYIVKIDEKSVKNVLNGIKKSFNSNIYRNILSGFSHGGVENYLLNYIQLCFKDVRFDANINIESIRVVHECSKRVGREIHKLHGFIRFVETKEGLFYAKISPKYDVLPFLAKHFIERFSSMDFIIHDLKNSFALIYKEQKLDFLKVEEFIAPELSSGEIDFQNLWRVFFDKVAIKERENRELQRSFVPLFYRDFMTEFSK